MCESCGTCFLKYLLFDENPFSLRILSLIHETKAIKNLSHVWRIVPVKHKPESRGILI